VAWWWAGWTPTTPRTPRRSGPLSAFVVALDLRETEVTLAADVVFPVAPVTDKAGTYVNWEGRTRPFDAVFTNPTSLPETRILAGIAEELGRPLGFRTVAEARSAMSDLGPWDGERATLPETPPEAKVRGPRDNELALATWKLMLDKGSMQHNEKHLAATARTPVCKVSAVAYAALGPMVTLTGDRGSVTLPVDVAPDLADDVVWVPANSVGNGVLADLASPGTGVRVKGADQ
jgi:NADH-quinone oxidoreductase subunit G